MTTLKILNKEFKMPRQKWLRIVLGCSLVAGGILGFLPILGFWMIPLGFVVLSMDFPVVRRYRRQIGVKWVRWRQSKTK